MAKIVILGSGTSIPAATHDLSSAALATPAGIVLFDCGGSPLHKMAQAQLDPVNISHIAVTHEHADHTCGFPSLLVGLWLLGRTAPLPLYGPPAALEVLQQLITIYNLDERWPALFPLEFHAVAVAAPARLFSSAHIDVHAAPGQHSKPVIGFRCTNRETGCTIVLTGDTAPCPTMLELARDADILIHEANFLNAAHIQANRERIAGGALLGITGNNPAHSTAAEAGRIAREAGVRQLVLTHCEPTFAPLEEFVAAARAEFAGAVTLAQDGAIYEL